MTIAWLAKKYQKPGGALMVLLIASLLVLGACASGPFGYDDWEESYWKSVHLPNKIWDMNKLGFHGAGVTIAAFDNGVILKHPAVGCAEPSALCRFLPGKNFVDDNDNVSPPLEEEHHHGTGVCLAAIGWNEVVASPARDSHMVPIRITGGVTFDPTKPPVVFDPNNPVYLKKAIDFAVEKGSKILTFSDGAASSWADAPIANLLDETADKGLLIYAAATNNGNANVAGLTTRSSAASVISVGNYDTGYIPAFEIKIRLSGNSIPPVSFSLLYAYGNIPIGHKTYSLTQVEAAVSLDTPSAAVSEAVHIDFCSVEETDANWPHNLASDDILLLGVGKSAMMKDDFDKCLRKIDKLLLEEKNGGSLKVTPGGVLLWTSPENKHLIRRYRLPQGVTGKPVGWLLDSNNADITLHLVLTALSSQDVDSVSVEFSERPIVSKVKNVKGWSAGLHPTSGGGPTWDLRFGIDILAPGTDILVAEDGGYGPSTGTSVATPIAAGAGSQLLSALRADGREPTTPDQFRALREKIIISGRPVLATEERSIKRNPKYPTVYEPAWRQCGGLANFRNAYSTTLQVSPAQIELGEIAASTTSWTRELIFKNPSDKFEILQLEHQPGPGQYQKSEGPAINSRQTENPLDMNLVAEVSFSENLFTIPPFAEKKIILHFEAPVVLSEDRRRFPLYGGWLFVTNSETEDEYSVSYFGAANRMNALSVIHDMPCLCWRHDPDMICLPATDKILLSRYRIPRFIAIAPVFLATGSPLVRLDYVDEKVGLDPDSQTWQYPPIKGSHGYVGLVKDGLVVQAERRARSDPLFRNVPLNGVACEENGLCRFLIPGRYRVRVMALKVGGDPMVESDWEKMTLPQVFVVPYSGRGVIG
ncbi:subtilisin-like protein [Ascobolus immersus RN42]|uniref:Subtilisin-like protein n=1 Tax=Ascobolus immersus RN42 TaxID=1160509 RepID=A0A3N4HSZ5_ASCIM|nr:subtilisin-like protein [Ascobolus immersus RN42]